MAIAFDVGGKSTVQSSVSSISFTGPTLGTLTNALVGVLVQERGASATNDLIVTSGTYDGNALTLGKAQLEPDSGGAGGSLNAEIWYRVGVGSGAKTVVVNFTGTVNTAMVYVGSLSGVDQSNPVDATAGAGDAENGTPVTTITTNITTNFAGSMLFDSIYHKIGTAMTLGASQTRIATESFPNGGGDTSNASYKDSGAAGAGSMAWTVGSADGWVHCIVAFRAHVAAGVVAATGFMTTNTKFWGM